MTLRFLVWGRYPITITRRGLYLEWHISGPAVPTCDGYPVPRGGASTFRCPADADRYWNALEVALGV